MSTKKYYIYCKVMYYIYKYMYICITGIYTRARGTLTDKNEITMKREIENIVKHSVLSEKAIEKYLVEQVRSWGGVCVKFSSFAATGYPDRIVMLPEGFLIWVELKSKGKKPNRIQVMRGIELEHVGQMITTVDSKEGVDALQGVYADWLASRGRRHT